MHIPMLVLLHFCKVALNVTKPLWLSSKDSFDLHN